MAFNYSSATFSATRLSRKSLKNGFRATTTAALLIGIIIIFWQIHWNIEISDLVFNWSFELEVCFGIYGLFLASTSYYLTQLQVRSWAQFHIVISAIGVVLDIIFFGYHINLIRMYNANIHKVDIMAPAKVPGPGNDYFMISITVIQTVNNCFAIFLSRQISNECEIRLLREEQIDDKDETCSTLLKESHL